MLLTMERTRDRSILSCIDECVSCHQACMETILYCYELGGSHAEPARMRLLYDCAQMCSALQDSATLNCPSAVPLSMVTGQVCRLCAASCETFVGDRPMEKCAEVCRRCGEACSTLASGKVMIG